MYCRKCGAKIKENSKFCNKCGTSVDEKIKIKKQEVIEIPDKEIKMDSKANNIVVLAIILLTLIISITCIVVLNI